MRKYVFAALIALCIAVPGTVNANSASQTEMTASSELSPQLIKAILQAAAEVSEWEYEELDQMYQAQVLTIEPVGSAYAVRVGDGGGMVVILIEDLL